MLDYAYSSAERVIYGWTEIYHNEADIGGGVYISGGKYYYDHQDVSLCYHCIFENTNDDVGY